MQGISVLLVAAERHMQRRPAAYGRAVCVYAYCFAV
jgi:hypothetical protein